MPYQTIQNFITAFGFPAWLVLLELLNKGWSHERIANCLPKSKRTGEKLSRRRVSQIVAKCCQPVYLPNEITKFYLENMLSSDQAGVDWAKKKLDVLKKQSEDANRELLQYIPGSADRQGAKKG